MSEVDKGPITAEDKLMREYVGFSMMGRPKRVIETAAPRHRVYTPDDSDIGFALVMLALLVIVVVLVLR